MENVLMSYAVVDPDIGYTQGLNYLAGVALDVLDDEEAAFWLLVSILKDGSKYRMNGLFVDGLGKLLFYFGNHEHLLYRTLPRLYNHFQNSGVRTSMYASAWYGTIFAASFPFPTVLRIWDVFLIDGADSLLQVSMTVLKDCEKELLALRELEPVRFLKNLHPEKHLSPERILREHLGGSALNFANPVQGGTRSPRVEKGPVARMVESATRATARPRRSFGIIPDSAQSDFQQRRRKERDAGPGADDEDDEAAVERDDRGRVRRGPEDLVDVVLFVAEDSTVHVQVSSLQSPSQKSLIEAISTPISQKLSI
jgi:hypothetical protein